MRKQYVLWFRQWKNPLWIVVPCHRVIPTVRSLDMQADCGVKVAIGTRKPNNPAKFILIRKNINK
jgi:hypothetical protein